MVEKCLRWRNKPGLCIKGKKKRKTQRGRTTTRGIYMDDKRDTYRHEDKDNREQEGSLC